jgi:hypothetical protein
MSKLITLAFTLAAAIAPAVVSAAPAKPNKCGAHPKDYLRQCVIEMGGQCDPKTGYISLTGPWGGGIKGEGALDQCVDRKRQQGRR